MQRALVLAAAAAAREPADTPVGAVVLDPAGRALAEAHNEVEADADPTAHAEVLALRRAARRLGRPRLDGCTLVVTLEPCAMCAQAASLARIARLVFGAWDPKGGGVDHGARIFDRETCRHRPEVVGGLMEAEAAALLTAFFRARRPGRDRDTGTARG